MNGTMKITALLLTSSMMTLGLSLSGCSAMNTAIEKHDLAVGTKMSETIFLEPVAPKYKVVYFETLLIDANKVKFGIYHGSIRKNMSNNSAWALV